MADRPSIAELQCVAECAKEGCWTDAQDVIVNAAPVLLEITAAALAWAESNSCDPNDEGDLALLHAIAKVRR